jgi:ABC-type multidrug transport system fused ATPase/permease subunit
MNNLKRLWSYLTKRRHTQFWLLLVLMNIATFAEIISIGMVVPFLAVITDPEQVYKYQLVQPIMQFFDIKAASQLVAPLTIAFIISIFLAGIIRLLLLYVMTRLSFAAGSDISVDMYRKTLYQKYFVHMESNSSELINGISRKTSMSIGVIRSSLTIVSSTIMLIGVMAALLAINLKIALIMFLGFGFIYLVVITLTHNKLKKGGQLIADKSTLMIKSLQEGLGGIRDVLIDGSQQFYCQIYRDADFQLRIAAGDNAIISGSPRFIIEAVGLTIIVIIAYFMTNSGSTSAIPIIGAFALGAQRLLPAVQQAYSAYTNIIGSKASFEDVLVLLDQELPSNIDQPLPLPMAFSKNIELKNLGFNYITSTDWILKNINLRFAKGSRIGFIGSTGVGKSTLLDIIMGLLDPTEGSVVVDDQYINDENKRSWQMHIAHVPQNVFLSDGSIEENIAFGVPKEKIDHERVKRVAGQARITELLSKQSHGQKNIIGERGIKISGGQRQRVGIARALYKQADILVFDEATSALDDSTERDIMNEIKELGVDLTIFIIAHRLTTLKICDQIIKLEANNRISSGSYQEIIGDRRVKEE